MRVSGIGTTGQISMVDLVTGRATDFTSGDTFALQITGATPNAPVVVTASWGTINEGTTDASGQYLLTDIVPADTVGPQSQQWTVGGQPVSPSPLTFNILAPPTQAAAQAAAQSGTTAGQQAAQAALANASSGSFLTQTISLFGMNLPVWMLAGGAAALILLMPSGGRR